MTVVGILLAGGQSRRFGSPKAFAEVEGQFFYEKVHRALEAVCDHVVIVARHELVPQFAPGLDVITDLPEVAGQGPLAGIYTAMCERPADRYIVLPCDMPYIGPQEVAALAGLSTGLSDVTAVKTLYERIPLFSMWNGSLKETLQNKLEKGQLGVMSFLKETETEWLDSSRIHTVDAVFRNINKPDQQKGR